MARTPALLASVSPASRPSLHQDYGYRGVPRCCSSPGIPFRPVSRTRKATVFIRCLQIHRATPYIHPPPAPLEKSDKEASQLVRPVPLPSYRRAAGCMELRGSHRWAATDVTTGRALLPGEFGRITGCCCCCRATCLLLNGLPSRPRHHFSP